jgi:hypothetical protein
MLLGNMSHWLTGKGLCFTFGLETPQEPESFNKK